MRENKTAIGSLERAIRDLTEEMTKYQEQAQQAMDSYRKFTTSSQVVGAKIKALEAAKSVVVGDPLPVKEGSRIDEVRATLTQILTDAKDPMSMQDLSVCLEAAGLPTTALRRALGDIKFKRLGTCGKSTWTLAERYYESQEATV